MRSYNFGPGGGLPQAVKWLLMANVGVFALQLLVGSEYYRMVLYLGLVPQLIIQKGFIWQFVTYMFLHGGVFHILFNMFALWMFGSEIERYWGSREFLKYYFLCGVGAGLLTFVTSLSSTVPTIGASGAIFGVLVAYAMMFPDRYIYIYFVLPVKTKYLVVFFAIIEFFASVNHTPDGIGHFAHLGGMLIGYLYLKLDWRIGNFFRKIKQAGHSWQERSRQKKEEEKRMLLLEVDRVLDKINRQGMDSLTKGEKKLLDDASAILSKKKEESHTD
ncbi:MAG: rhomboid family intramembrane serine protease [candidate division Zixibacteria bacterium]|nr:rhomboid family intramembrane serine protease [candidate division Zixibacteria bacterium]